MNRKVRLLVTGAVLVAGATFLAGPARADCCLRPPHKSLSALQFGPAGSRLAPVAPEPDEEVVADFLSGPWFPSPVGVE
ncbi:hypothetical protein [Actinoplanes sp. G11-F43]|uniref:hypothetical protein n=1 Tax=Actinoplanes sp. G11-F43 TaxID=3424130 RepID=UPI003D356E99